MNTNPKKPPPRIHQAPKRYGEEQDKPGPSKKKKAGSAEKSTKTTSEKQTKKSAHQSTLKMIPKQKPKPIAEEAGQQSEPTREPTQISSSELENTPHTDGSDDESEKQNNLEENDIEILEEPAESAEAELSMFFFATAIH